MDRIEFMRQLAQLLSDIPEEERREALEYYESYFEDAGPENEDKILQQLGSPGKVAAVIKANLREDASEYGEYTERGYEDRRMDDSQKMELYEEKEDYRKRRFTEPKKKNTANTILFLIVLVLGCMVFGPVLVGLAAAVVGLLVAAAAVIFSCGAAGVSCMAAGAATVFCGIIRAVTSIGDGFLAMAAGFGLVVLGILLMLAFLWLTFKCSPFLLRKCLDLLQKLVRRFKNRKVSL